MSDVGVSQIIEPVLRTAIARKEEEVFEGNGTRTPNLIRQQKHTIKYRVHPFTTRKHRGHQHPIQRKRRPLQTKERCTFCWRTTYQTKTVGQDARLACQNCWKLLWNLAVCWSCGDMIVRTEDEEVVSLEWCFWHRSCFGCLFCRVPMELPSNVGGVVRGVELNKVPICGRCEAHVEDVSQQECWKRDMEMRRDMVSKNAVQGTDGASGDAVMFEPGRSLERIGLESFHRSKDDREKKDFHFCTGLKEDSIRHRKEVEGSYKQTIDISIEPTRDTVLPSTTRTRTGAQTPPKWMSLLPGSRKALVPHFEPSILPSQMLGYAGEQSIAWAKDTALDLQDGGKNYTTPSYLPIATIEYLSSIPPGERTARTQSIRRNTILPLTSPSHFPFFQNPKAPIVPSIDSSWGRCSQLKADLAYPGFIRQLGDRSSISQPEPITTSEYTDRYVDTPQKAKEIRRAQVCILCGQSSSVDKFILAPNDKTYHCSCFVCRVCHNPHKPAEENMDAYICFGVFPSHRRCISGGADAILTKLRKKETCIFIGQEALT